MVRCVLRKPEYVTRTAFVRFNSRSAVRLHWSVCGSLKFGSLAVTKFDVPTRVAPRLGSPAKVFGQTIE